MASPKFVNYSVMISFAMVVVLCVHLYDVVLHMRVTYAASKVVDPGKLKVSQLKYLIVQRGLTMPTFPKKPEFVKVVRNSGVVTVGDLNPSGKPKVSRLKNIIVQRGLTVPFYLITIYCLCEFFVFVNRTLNNRIKWFLWMFTILNLGALPLLGFIYILTMGCLSIWLDDVLQYVVTTRVMSPVMFYCFESTSPLWLCVFFGIWCHCIGHLLKQHPGILQNTGAYIQLIAHDANRAPPRPEPQNQNNRPYVVFGRAIPEGNLNQQHLPRRLDILYQQHLARLLDNLHQQHLVELLGFPRANLTYIAGLPRWRHNQQNRQQQHNDGGNCVFCQEELVEGDRMCGLPCGHSFHEMELIHWLGGEYGGNHSCPLCRQRAY